MPGMKLLSALATPSNVLWSSLRTMTRQLPPRPEPGPDVRGFSIVWTGQKEIAELYWEQLRDAGLTMAPLEQG